MEEKRALKDGGQATREMVEGRASRGVYTDQWCGGSRWLERVHRAGEPGDMGAKTGSRESTHRQLGASVTTAQAGG